ncbi:hypothetical protein CK503_13880 [Aliifodinibius salipaludis]|uniref:Outer membrane protein beta-barrel domain-containing protein n=1 Tax=Fodinibius salipaludis TaxID=2032627 RepID=A0A2A2G6T8_9BACT|nr:carboxypeptidase-like regulatory domain-containing protein [Aliifodinibius salipaludis]PAU93008.1 hypothetical protein CK503_13880 [Aliifodinibius salipaludis]
MRIYIIILFGAFILSGAEICQAQIFVQGTITDSLGHPIPNVNIYATGLDSTSIKAFDYSNGKGEFSLELNLRKIYLLHISSIGYGKQIIDIPAHSKADTLFKNILLKEKTQPLKELVVEEKRPSIIAKEDTTIFIAESFMRGNEESVEDILRLLPGITITPQGQIKANGKTVTKVLIGGDDLFGFNYQLLTKNFTAKAIETVSIYEEYQENAVLKNISESDETVLNLALKEEFKIDFFGTATGYYDLDQNYQADGNLVSITKNFKGYLFESANNIGDNPVGNIYRLLQSGSSLPFQSSTSLGPTGGSGSLVSTTAHRVSRLDQEQYLNNKTSFHGGAGIYNLSEDLKIKAVGYFLPANRQINQQFATIYDPSLQVPNLIQRQNTQKDINAGLGNLTATYDPSQKFNLKYEGKFNTFPETELADRVFRNEPLQTQLETDEKKWSQHLRFTRKIADRKAYRIRVRYINSSNAQTLRVNPVLSGGPFGSDSTANPLMQQTKNDGSYIGTDFKYWSRNARSLFSVRLGGEHQSNSLANRVAGQPAFTDSRDWNRYRTFSTLSYQYTIGKGWEANAEVSGNLVWNRTNLQAVIDETLFYLNPEVSVTYEPNKKNELRLQYSYKQDQPDFNTLFSAQRLTDYRSIQEGTTDFSLSPSNSFSASYQYGNWQDNFVANTFFSYVTSGQSYTTASTITPNYNFGTYRLTDNQETLLARLGLDQFMNFLQSNLAFEYNYTSASFTSFFNDTANDIQSNSHQLSTYLRTAFVGAFNSSIGAEYNFSESNNQTNNFISSSQYFSGFANTTLDLGDRWQLSTEYILYQIEDAGDYHFLNTSLQFDAIDDRLTLYLDGRNLLDQTAFETVNVGSYTQSQRRNALNPRFVLLGAKISFR